MKTTKKMDLIGNLETKALERLEEAIEKEDTKSVNAWLWIVANVQKIQ